MGAYRKPTRSDTVHDFRATIDATKLWRTDNATASGTSSDRESGTGFKDREAGHLLAWLHLSDVDRRGTDAAHASVLSYEGLLERAWRAYRRVLVRDYG